MLIITFILVMAFIFANYYKTKRFLHMLQQNLYNENNRYVKWVLKNKEQFLDLELGIIGICILGLLNILKAEFLLKICLLMISLTFILLGLKWRKKIKLDQNKKKLVITARIKRLLVTIILLFTIPLVFLGLNIEIAFNYWLIVLILGTMTLLNAFLVLIAMFINYPIEKCVYLHYKRKAQKKLKEMNNLKIIGITGSYGKTSSKNILAAILNCKYNTLPTPKNLNTYNGLIMTVNNYMDKFTNIFIAEMGAYVKGEIKGLCKLVKPQYGILTTIGTAHLESFGSEQNIIDGKFELIESLPEDGFAISLDNYTIVKGAKNKANAYKFIDYILRDDVQKKITDEYPYISTTVNNMTQDYDELTHILYDGSYVKNIGYNVSKFDKVWAQIK